MTDKPIRTYNRLRAAVASGQVSGTGDFTKMTDELEGFLAMAEALHNWRPVDSGFKTARACRSAAKAAFDKGDRAFNERLAKAVGFLTKK